MSGWFEFAAVLTLFLLSHVFPMRPPMRPWLVHHIGLRGYLLAYSLGSFALLIWLLVAAGRAPYVEIIAPFDALRWAPILTMPVVCLLAVFGLSVDNPLSFGGLGKRRFDPEKPGILALTRHPLLLSIGLWALVHLLANGDLAHVILFGLFVLFPVLSMALIDRRKQRQLGDDWQRLAKNTSRFSVAELVRRPWVWLMALGLFATMVLLHGPVIGVSPWPIWM